MKFLPTQLIIFLQSKPDRRNMRLLMNFLAVLIALVLAFTIFFHLLMLRGDGPIPDLPDFTGSLCYVYAENGNITHHMSSVPDRMMPPEAEVILIGTVEAKNLFFSKYDVKYMKLLVGKLVCQKHFFN